MGGVEGWMGSLSIIGPPVLHFFGFYSRCNDDNSVCACILGYEPKKEMPLRTKKKHIGTEPV